MSFPQHRVAVLFLALAGAACPLAAAVQAPSTAERAARRADPAITAADLEACVVALASDEMLGRRNGTEECARAGRWLGEALARAGVAPAGDDGTYFQKVPLASIEYREVPVVVVWTGPEKTRELSSGVDFSFAGGVPSKRSRLRVKVVSKAEQMPKFVEDELALFLDGSARERREWLGEGRGAGYGLIITPGTKDPGAEKDETPPRSRTLQGEQARSSVASIQAHGELLAGLRDGTVKALRLECATDFKELPSFNVVGRIDGVGTKKAPKLAEEAVVFSAHYDHIGEDDRARSGADATVDRIRNGADDDASGCAAVLELAEAFAAGPKPARTLIFFFATGEEIGLVGTHHYLNYPVVPIERTVANLNFEMIGRPDEKCGGAGKLWLTGFERSNLGAEFQKLGLPIVEDRRPEQHFFERSDNYAFAVKGVVAQTLSSYNMHGDYHQPGDEPDTLDYEHMETCVRAAFDGSKALADGSLTPAWIEGKSPKR